MTFEELINLPVVKSTQADDLDIYDLYDYPFLLDEPYEGAEEAKKALQALNGRIDILYRDDEGDQGGKVSVIYAGGIPVLVYQMGDSWSGEDELFVLDSELYIKLQFELIKARVKYTTYNLDSKVPSLYGKEPRLSGVHHRLSGVHHQGRHRPSKMFLNQLPYDKIIAKTNISGGTRVLDWSGTPGEVIAKYSETRRITVRWSTRFEDTYNLADAYLHVIGT